METQDNTSPSGPVQEQEDQKKPNLLSRGLVTGAFAWVGWHLAPFGLAIDGASILKGEPNKFRALRGLREKLKDKIANQLGPNPTRSEKFKARAGVFKYTLIFTAVGVVAGGIIGWIRGERAGSISEIIHHPFEATKAVLGPKQKEQENPAPILSTAKADSLPQVPSGNNTNWSQRTNDQQQQAVNRLI